MREAFARELAQLELRITADLRNAAVTLGEIAEAVFAPTGERVGRLAQEASRLRAASRRLDADLVTVTARQAPVASDLRLILVLLGLAQRAELIANQFELINEQFAQIDARVESGHPTAEWIAEMARVAAAELSRALAALTARDLAEAEAIDGDDDVIDELNRRVFGTVRLENTVEQRRLGLRHVLIARSLERIGDNAVDVAEQTVFLITRELREFSDASHPR
jgi:phosphate transport system protein